MVIIIPTNCRNRPTYLIEHSLCQWTTANMAMQAMKRKTKLFQASRSQAQNSTAHLNNRFTTALPQHPLMIALLSRDSFFDWSDSAFDSVFHDHGIDEFDDGFLVLRIKALQGLEALE